MADRSQTAGTSPFVMPPEWHRHEATWMAWPHNLDTWPNNLAAAQNEFTDFVVALSDDEPVNVIAGGEALEAAASRLGQRSNVRIVEVPTNDAWIRDYGPTFVIGENRQQLAAIDWGYNAWGGKYPPFDLDQAVTARVAEHLGIRRVEPGIVLEGGAIDINSNGILLVTRSCVIDERRNPGQTCEQLERSICQQTGASQILWLPGDGENGPCIEGDDTDGHIDQLARFVNDTTIVYAMTHDRARTEYLPLVDNLHELTTAIRCTSLEIELIPLPLPDAVGFEGVRSPASYCNFYISNQSVLVPQFGVRQDAEAIAILRDLFPSRNVIGLPSNNLSVGLGSFHCLTQQQPAINQFV